LPEAVGGLPPIGKGPGNFGEIAVSPDGATLAVLTASGLSLVSTLPPVAASLTYPSANDTNIDTTKAFTWSTVPAAQGYYLAVGTTGNGADLVNSGVLPATTSTYPMPDLPAGKPLYATLMTETNGTWTLFQAITFTAAAGHATLTNPLAGQTNLDTTKPFTWNTAPGAQGYYLVVGTTQYGSDLVNSTVLAATQTSYPTPDLPAGKPLYATLLTETNGTWTRYQAITFTAAAGHATFTNPVAGQTNVTTTKPFTWAAIAGAQGYIVAVGAHPYGHELANSGVLPATQTAYTAPTLPAGKTLYATLLTNVNGTYSRSQLITFTTT
jgi:hypothetical protein